MAKLLPFAIVMIASAFYFWFNYSTFNPEVELKGKNVLITGASSGIGEELAYQYAKYQANIIITARRQPLLNKVADKCRQLGANKVVTVVADVSKVAARDFLLQETQTHFGSNLDYLILNHGAFKIDFWTGGDQNMTFLHQIMDTNFVSFVDLATRGVPLLQKNRGHIGVVSGLSVKVSYPRMAVPSASKAALHGFFPAWRQELKFSRIPVSITVCVLGLIDTQAVMVQTKDLQSFISPDVVAASVEGTAAAIIQSVALGQYEMYYPKFLAIYSIFHQLFKTYFDDFAASQLLTAVRQ